MKAKNMRQEVGIMTLLAITSITAGCGHYPAPIRSAWSITLTPASEHMVVIVGLPLADWPKLAKFRELQHFNIARDYATSVTDDHLIALSKLNLPKLRQVSLAYSSQVTDNGLNALTNFPAIEGLQLIGVAITDRSMDTLVTGFPHLEGVNVEQCRFLSSTGFLALAKSPTIKAVILSLDPLSQPEIEHIIASLPNITRWTISDPSGRLSVESIRRIAWERNKIFVADKDNFVREIQKAQPTNAPYSSTAAGSNR